jgi:hypothetical protein
MNPNKPQQPISLTPIPDGYSNWLTDMAYTVVNIKAAAARLAAIF